MFPPRGSGRWGLLGWEAESILPPSRGGKGVLRDEAFACCISFRRVIVPPGLPHQMNSGSFPSHVLTTIFLCHLENEKSTGNQWLVWKGLGLMHTPECSQIQSCLPWDLSLQAKAVLAWLPWEKPYSFIGVCVPLLHPRPWAQSRGMFTWKGTAKVLNCIH